MIVFLIFSLSKIPARKENNYSYTKAFCNETNYCQDYEIKCDGEKIIEMAPITGATIQLPKNWEDPREKENLCN